MKRTLYLAALVVALSTAPMARADDGEGEIQHKYSRGALSGRMPKGLTEKEVQEIKVRTRTGQEGSPKSNASTTRANESTAERTPTSTASRIAESGERRRGGEDAPAAGRRKPWAMDVLKGVKRQTIGNECPGGSFRVVGNQLVLPGGQTVPFQRDDATAEKLRGTGKVFGDRKIGGEVVGGARMIGIKTTLPPYLAMKWFYTVGERVRVEGDRPGYYLGDEDSTREIDGNGMEMGSQVYAATAQKNGLYCLVGGGGGGGGGGAKKGGEQGGAAKQPEKGAIAKGGAPA